MHLVMMNVVNVTNILELEPLLIVQSCSSIPMQSSLFSHYKLHVACKGLVSIDPSGEITLFIKLHDGAISNVKFYSGVAS